MIKREEQHHEKVNSVGTYYLVVQVSYKCLTESREVLLLRISEVNKNAVMNLDVTFLLGPCIYHYGISKMRPPSV